MFWRNVYIYIPREYPLSPNLVPDILNCAWIQLCYIENEDLNYNPVLDPSTNLKIINYLGSNNCLGSAIIRNIDVQNQCFYIITPENQAIVEKVNCLVKPQGISIPDEILISQELYSFDCVPPYVNIA